VGRKKYNGAEASKEPQIKRKNEQRKARNAKEHRRKKTEEKKKRKKHAPPTRPNAVANKL
jgi:hypothetical protein